MSYYQILTYNVIQFYFECKSNILILRIVLKYKQSLKMVSILYKYSTVFCRAISENDAKMFRSCAILLNSCFVEAHFLKVDRRTDQVVCLKSRISSFHNIALFNLSVIVVQFSLKTLNHLILMTFYFNTEKY